MRDFKLEWAKITSDSWILQTISGYKLEITGKPWQTFVPQPIQFNKREQEQINNEVIKFQDKNIIEEVTGNEKDQFYSNIFTRPKKDGSIRVILNLKKFNELYVEKIHFKMETLKTAVTSI